MEEGLGETTKKTEDTRVTMTSDSKNMKEWRTDPFSLPGFYYSEDRGYTKRKDSGREDRKRENSNTEDRGRGETKKIIQGNKNVRNRDQGCAKEVKNVGADQEKVSELQNTNRDRELPSANTELQTANTNPDSLPPHLDISKKKKKKKPKKKKKNMNELENGGSDPTIQTNNSSANARMSQVNAESGKGRSQSGEIKQGNYRTESSNSRTAYSSQGSYGRTDNTSQDRRGYGSQGGYGRTDNTQQGRTGYGSQGCYGRTGNTSQDRRGYGSQGSYGRTDNIRQERTGYGSQGHRGRIDNTSQQRTSYGSPGSYERPNNTKEKRGYSPQTRFGRTEQVPRNSSQANFQSPTPHTNFPSSTPQTSYHRKGQMSQANNPKTGQVLQAPRPRVFSPSTSPCLTHSAPPSQFTQGREFSDRRQCSKLRNAERGGGIRRPDDRGVRQGTSQPYCSEVRQATSQPYYGEVRQGTSQPYYNEVMQTSQPYYGEVRQGTSHPHYNEVKQATSQPKRGQEMPQSENTNRGKQTMPPESTSERSNSSEGSQRKYSDVCRGISQKDRSRSQGMSLIDYINRGKQGTLPENNDVKQGRLPPKSAGRNTGGISRMNWAQESKHAGRIKSTPQTGSAVGQKTSQLPSNMAQKMPQSAQSGCSMNQGKPRSASTMDQKMSQSTSNMDQKMPQATSVVDQKMSQTASNMDQKMSNPTSNMDQKMSQPTSSMDQKMSQPTSNMDQMSQPTSNMDQKTSQLTSSMDQMSQPSSSMDQKMSQPTSSMDQKTSQSASTMDQKTSQSTSSMDHKMSQSTFSMDQKMSQPGSSVVPVKSQLSSNMDRKITESGASVVPMKSQLSSNMDQKVSQSGSSVVPMKTQVSSDMDQSTSQVNASMSYTVDQKTSQANLGVDRRKYQPTSAMDNVMSQLYASLSHYEDRRMSQASTNTKPYGECKIMSQPTLRIGYPLSQPHTSEVSQAMSDSVHPQSTEHQNLTQNLPSGALEHQNLPHISSSTFPGAPRSTTEEFYKLLREGKEQERTKSEGSVPRKGTDVVKKVSSVSTYPLVLPALPSQTVGNVDTKDNVVSSYTPVHPTSPSQMISQMDRNRCTVFTCTPVLPTLPSYIVSNVSHPVLPFRLKSHHTFAQPDVQNVQNSQVASHSLPEHHSYVQSDQLNTQFNTDGSVQPYVKIPSLPSQTPTEVQSIQNVPLLQASEVAYISTVHPSQVQGSVQNVQNPQLQVPHKLVRHDHNYAFQLPQSDQLNTPLVAPNTDELYFTCSSLPNQSSAKPPMFPYYPDPSQPSHNYDSPFPEPNQFNSSSRDSENVYTSCPSLSYQTPAYVQDFQNLPLPDSFSRFESGHSYFTDPSHPGIVNTSLHSTPSNTYQSVNKNEQLTHYPNSSPYSCPAYSTPVSSTYRPVEYFPPTLSNDITPHQTSSGQGGETTEWNTMSMPEFQMCVDDPSFGGKRDLSDKSQYQKWNRWNLIMYNHVLFRNVSPTIPLSTLKIHAEKMGVVVRMMRVNTGVVVFYLTPEAARKACDHQHEVLGFKIEALRPRRPSVKLYVKDLLHNTTDSDVLRAFSKYGAVWEYDRPGQLGSAQRHYCFVSVCEEVAKKLLEQKYIEIKGVRASVAISNKSAIQMDSLHCPSFYFMTPNKRDIARRNDISNTFSGSTASGNTGSRSYPNTDSDGPSFGSNIKNNSYIPSRDFGSKRMSSGNNRHSSSLNTSRSCRGSITPIDNFPACTGNHYIARSNITGDTDSSSEVPGGPGIVGSTPCQTPTYTGYRALVIDLPVWLPAQCLTDYFSRFGRVLKTELLVKRPSLAYVIFESEASLEKAVSSKHHIFGAKFRVMRYVTKECRVYVGNLSPTVSIDMVMRKMQEYGEVVQVYHPPPKHPHYGPSRFCFVSFKEERVARNLIELGTVCINNNHLVINPVRKIDNKADG